MELADLHFPGTVQIVDLYYARQHLWNLARKLYPNHTVSQQAWIKILSEPNRKFLFPAK